MPTAPRSKKTTRSKPKSAGPARAPVTAALPEGKWTVLRFDSGPLPALLLGVVAETLENAAASREPGDRWIAQLGEYFMNEGSPVLRFSPDVPQALIHSLSEFTEMVGGAEVSRRDLRSMAFAGRTLVRMEGSDKVG